MTSADTGPRKQAVVLRGWIDWVVALVVISASATTLGLSWHSGVFGLPIADDGKLGWHLVRAAGMTAYGLLSASTLWGLFLTSRAIKDWSPGPVSLLLHAAAAWLAVVFSFAHAALLLFDTYYHYTIRDLAIPFVGPYRPLAVGLGIIGAWLILAVTISFSMRKLISQRIWRLFHYTSYLAFILVTIHAVFSGTDASAVPMRLMLGGFTAATAILFSWRVGQAVRRKKQKPIHSRQLT